MYIILYCILYDLLYNLTRGANSLISPRWGSRSFGTKNIDPLQVFVSTVHKAQTSGCLRKRNPTHMARGRKPFSWAKFPAKRRNYQRFTSTTCVGEDLRFPPHHGPRKYGSLFFVRLLREPLLAESLTTRHAVGTCSC